MDKHNVVYPYNGILFGHKKELMLQHGCQHLMSQTQLTFYNFFLKQTTLIKYLSKILKF